MALRLLSSCGQELSCSVACGILLIVLGPGIKPVFPELEGRFLTTGPPGVHTCSMCPLFATLWIVAYQAPLPIRFSRQKYWNMLPRPPPGDLPNPRIEPTSVVSPALSGRFFTTGPPGKTFGSPGMSFIQSFVKGNLNPSQAYIPFNGFPLLSE